jgi:hypothetical protein
MVPLSTISKVTNSIVDELTKLYVDDAIEGI